MKLLKHSLLVLSSLLMASSMASAAERPIQPKFLGTRAIVACDAAARACGMAVISFPTGITGMVPYGRSDVAVATMAAASPDSALAVLSRVDAGEAPQDAIDAVMAADPLGRYRQLAAVKLHPDGTVVVGQRSGERNTRERCAIKGATYAVQANNMSTADICRAMAEGYERATGSLPQRLLASLKAGAEVGGDNSGERSGVVRVWNSTADSAFYTHLFADAVVNAEPEALKALELQLNRYQAVIAPPDPADLVVFDAPTIQQVKKQLRELGYYHGPMNGTWSDAAEQALADFTWNNCFFDRPTVVVDGVRKVDGPLAHFLRHVAPGGVAPATPAE